MSGDDLLSPDEIEALLKQAQGNSPPAPPPQEQASESTSNENMLNPAEIEQMMGQATGGNPGDQSSPVTPSINPQNTQSQAEFQHAERLISQAEADLAAAIAPNLSRPHMMRENQETTDFPFQQFGVKPPSNDRKLELEALQDVELDLRIELGRTHLLIEEILKFQSGTVVPLDKLAGDPVDIIVNDRLVARGEVLVLNDNFCVRISEIVAPDD